MNRLLLLIGLLTIAPLSRAEAQCAVGGYPITVAALGDATADSTFLASTARIIALRWATPSLRRTDFTQWRRVRERTLPEIPRWADDWRPDSSHKAEFVIVLRRRGRSDLLQPTTSSSDRLFDRSLESVLRDPLPGSPDLPLLPASVSADTLALRVRFGVEPETLMPGMVRFAAIQTPVEVVPGTLQMTFQRRAPTTIGGRNTSAAAAVSGIEATVKYDVTVEGTIDPRSLQLVDSNDREFGRTVMDALVRARFNAATTNCQPVRISVLQKFNL